MVEKLPVGAGGVSVVGCCTPRPVGSVWLISTGKIGSCANSFKAPFDGAGIAPFSPWATHSTLSPSVPSVPAGFAAGHFLPAREGRSRKFRVRSSPCLAVLRYKHTLGESVAKPVKEQRFF